MFWILDCPPAPVATVANFGAQDAVILGVVRVFDPVVPLAALGANGGGVVRARYH